MFQSDDDTVDETKKETLEEFPLRGRTETGASAYLHRESKCFSEYPGSF